MINLSTSNKEMLAELQADYAKADYWLKKKIGGPHKVSELQEKLMLDYYTTGKLQISDPVEYISPNGNRWLMYFRTKKVGGHVTPIPMGFCYYETYGSIGAFLPMNSKSIRGMDGVLIFPSHFFLRLDERLNLGVRSREVVKRFVEMIDNMIIQYKGDSDKRRDEVEVSFSGSVWRGRFREGDRNFMELNTFIPQSALSSKKQYEDARELQEVQDNFIPHTKETDFEELEHGDAVAWMQRLLDDVNTKRVQDHVTGAYFYYYNMTELVAKEVGIDINGEIFDGMLMAEARGETRLGMIKYIYQLAYDLVSDDEFGIKLHAYVFVVLRKLGYTGTVEDLKPHHEKAVEKYMEWIEKRKEAFEKQFKKRG